MTALDGMVKEVSRSSGPLILYSDTGVDLCVRKALRRWP